jgi:hypothetical protein
MDELQQVKLQVKGVCGKGVLDISDILAMSVELYSQTTKY